MTTACIALGANLGDPQQQLRQALAALACTPGIVLRQTSRFYRSAALGPAGQPDYCNAVCVVDTSLSADALLTRLQAIENAAGRIRSERWGPRVLDLDLLWMDGVASDTPRLQLPHPQAHLRAFVLVPLADLLPNLEWPGHGRVAALAASIDRDGVVPLND